MLDVHPPHEAAHNWKDFFIHVGTICVGLLIAVGLEQSVEGIHRHRESSELRGSLDHETEQVLHDTENVEAYATITLPWLAQLQQQVSHAALAHQPVGKFPEKPGSPDFDVPDNPVYAAAKAGNRISLLTEEETVAYGELAGLLVRGSAAYVQMRESQQTLDQDLRKLRFNRSPIDPQSDVRTSTLLSADTLTNPELTQLYSDLVDIENATRYFVYWSRQTRGAATAMNQGERNLHRIEAAERQFDNLP